MLENDLEEMKKNGSLKNITNITEKIQLTKRARYAPIYFKEQMHSNIC